MNDFYKPFYEQVLKADSENKRDLGFQCPTCNSNLQIKLNKDGSKFLACPGWPSCKYTRSCEVKNDKIILTDPKGLVEGLKCKSCNSGMIKRISKYGAFYACVDEHQTGCKKTQKVPFGKKCPDCNGELTYSVWNEQPQLSCLEYPKCYYKVNVKPVPKEKL